jgi:tetratricopeptide (TPR) repeat protein
LGKLKKIVVCLLLTLSCCKNNSELPLKDVEINLDALLTKAQDDNLDKEIRLHYLDKAEQRLLKTKYDAAKRDKYYQLAAAYFVNDDEDKYHEILEYVKDKCFELKDTLGIIHTECQIANYNIRDFKIDSAYYYLSDAERFSMQLKEKPFIGTILINKADLEFFQKDFAGAEVKAVKALKIANYKKDDRLIYDCYITIGNSVGGINNFDKAVEYYEKAITKATDLKATRSILV